MKSLSVCLAALFILLCVALASSTKLACLQPLSPCDGTTDCVWDLVTNNANTIKIVTIDVSVNVSTPDQRLLDAVVEARLAGIKIFARIKTGYAKISLVDVKAHIDLIVRLYAVDGFVFDEVPSKCSCQTYYSDLYAYVKANVAGLVVLNVGVNVPECFGLFGDILVVFDSSYEEYKKFVPLAWYANSPVATFWHNIHSCPAPELKVALSLTIKNKAGFCFVTDKAAGVELTILDIKLQIQLLGLLSLNLNVLGL